MDEVGTERLSEATADSALGIPLPPRAIDPREGPYGAQYGAKLIAARYSGLKKPPARLGAEWQHGWIPPERNVHPESVLGTDGLTRQRKSWAGYLVARDDQREYLRQCGYAYVKAIGLPLVYLPKPRVTRAPRSLLVMPAHSLPETTEEWDGEEYAAYIQKAARRFSHVVVCVHASCLEKGNWAPAFRGRGMQVVAGADVRDSNSLLRMGILFSRFEFVTSNIFGSHIAYSAYFGAKPSVSGPRPRWRREHYQNSILYRNAPELLDIGEDWEREDMWRQEYPAVHVAPWEAKDLRRWAAWQLGEQCKLPSEELRETLGWSSPLSFGHLKLRLRRIRYHYLTRLLG